MTHAHTQRHARRAVGVVALLALAAASCSSDAKQADPATTPETAAAQVTTSTTVDTVSDTTLPDTTVPTSDSGADTSVPDFGGPVYPLTGTPILDIVLAGRPALVVKVDNHPDARPQSGVNEADIVFEENVENLTRFALVFQSNGADPVGPIRSGRTQDVNLLGSFNKPLFAWSGGNGRVTAAILASDLRQISPQSNGPFFRTNRKNPHNLYSKVTDLYKLSPPDASAPKQQFLYRAAGATPAGDDISAAKLSMDGIKVLWQWDTASKTFLRFSDGKVHKDAITDTQVNTDNVVVLFVAYKPSPADGSSPEAQTTGTGEAWVFSAGKLVKGTWNRPDRLSPFVLTDGSGAPMLLTPGRTFVELSRTGKAVSVAAGAKADSVPFP